MQKISPFLWFDRNCEEALHFYTNLFPNSKIESIQKYPDEALEEHMKGMEGKILTAVFTLNGYRFMALDGGPVFKPTPGISFFVHCKTEEEVQTYWDALSKDGKELMPLDKYDFSEKYGWCQDKYGFSWQITLSKDTSHVITPSLLFVQSVAGKATEAMNFYTSVFPNSNVGMTAPYPPAAQEKEGAIMYGEFTLMDQQFVAMDSSMSDHHFSFTEAISFYVECTDQKEVDTYWEALSSVSESEQCGWLKDKYGVSWQIIPSQLGKLMSDPDPEKATRVMQAMLQMKKIVIEDLEKAYKG
jgi:predicted 3-demethylubiquinone-9 3-methyltransferase (glyoxalase superfamily)